MRPFLDKVMPEAWQAARSYSAAIRDAALDRGLDPQESRHPVRPRGPDGKVIR